eukprot:2270-Heterococcus_DN1.PRE.1
MVEAVKTIEHSIGKFTEVVLEGCAYAATGNVLKVQKVRVLAVCLCVLCLYALAQRTGVTTSRISGTAVSLSMTLLCDAISCWTSNAST